MIMTSPGTFLHNPAALAVLPWLTPLADCACSFYQSLGGAFYEGKAGCTQFLANQVTTVL